MITRDIKQQIDQLSRELRLPTFRRECESVAQEATQEKLSFEHFLLRLMAVSYTHLTLPTKA